MRLIMATRTDRCRLRLGWETIAARRKGKAVYDPGDKATLTNGKWTPHARSQFRINLNDVAAIYGEVREVDMRDPESY